MVPIAYILADQERNEDYEFLLKFANLALEGVTGCRFLQNVDHVFVDGMCSHDTLKALCPEASIHTCLEHTKRNVTKHIGGGLGKMAVEWVEVTAFLHSEFLFHAAWDVVCVASTARSTRRSAVEVSFFVQNGLNNCFCVFFLPNDPLPHVTPCAGTPTYISF